MYCQVTTNSWQSQQGTFKAGGKQRLFVIVSLWRVFLGGLPSKYQPCLSPEIWQNWAIPCHLPFQINQLVLFYPQLFVIKPCFSLLSSALLFIYFNNNVSLSHNCNVSNNEQVQVVQFGSWVFITLQFMT